MSIDVNKISTSNHSAGSLRVVSESFRVPGIGTVAPAAMAEPSDERPQLTLRETAYEQLIEVHPTSVGKAVSRRERESRRLRSQDMTYGEIKFMSFATIFDWIRERLGELGEPGGVFYDLGSGAIAALHLARRV